MRTRLTLSPDASSSGLDNSLPSGRTQTDRATQDSVLQITALKLRNSEPSVAAHLAELMMTAEEKNVRAAAQDTLGDTSDQYGKKMLRIAEQLQELSYNWDGCFSSPRGLDQIIQDLREHRSDPLVRSRLLELIVGANKGASLHVAGILRGTTDPIILKPLKEILREVTKDKYGYQRMDPYVYVPLALSGSSDPEVLPLLLKAAQIETPSIILANFPYQALRALGTYNNSEVKSLLMQSFYKQDVRWMLRSGVSYALRSLMDSDIRTELKALINCSLEKSAMLIAQKQSETLLGVFTRACDLGISQRDYVSTIRVQAALALVDVEPALAQSIFEEVQPAHAMKCDVGAASEAGRELRKMSKKPSRELELVTT